MCGRWKRDAHGNISLRGGEPVLEFVSIQRKDNGQWAIPGVRLASSLLLCVIHA